MQSIKKKKERAIKRRASLLLYRCVIYCLNNSLQGLELTGESKAATAQQPKTATVYQYIPATVGQPKVKEKIRVTTLEDTHCWIFTFQLVPVSVSPPYTPLILQKQDI